MGGKPKAKDKKKKKLTAEEEAKAKMDAVDDIDDEDYKKALRKECRELEKQITAEEEQSILYQDER